MLKSYIWIDFFFQNYFHPRLNEPTSDGQENAKMTDFDQIWAHSFRHLPSLRAVGVWLLPLWCKNMPFGESTALWRALLNYPKTFSSCTFITPREDKQGERAALKDRRSCSDVMDDWLRCGFKRTSTPSGASELARFHCSAHHPTESFMAFQPAAEQTLAVDLLFEND